MTHRETAVALAWHLLWRPYIWGGDDPQGFDCSGLVVEILKSVGLMDRRDDSTADGLYRRYPHVRHDEVRPGDLVFWSRAPGVAQIVHVGIVVDPPDLYIGAEGGGRWATDPTEALRRNAYVQMRPVLSRGEEDTRFFASPGYRED